MKKVKFFLIAAVLLGMGVLAGCRKNDPVWEDRGVLTVKTAPTADDSLTLSRIKSFIESCRKRQGSAGGPAENVMSAVEAAWLIEAGLNFAYGHPAGKYSRRYSDSLDVLLPATAGNVKLADATALANSLLDSLCQFYGSVSAIAKKVISIDVVQKNATAGSVMLGVTLSVGDETNPPGWWYPFGDDDYWYYGYLQGKCGPYIGSGFGWDAALKMEYYQDFFHNWPVVLPGYKLSFTGQMSVVCNAYDLPNPDDPHPSDNYYDYLLFYNNPAWINYHDCLVPEEMNTYFNFLHKVIWDELYLPTQNPSTWSFIEFRLFPMGIINFQGGPTPSIYHMIKVTYGKPFIHQDPLFPRPAPSLNWY